MICMHLTVPLEFEFQSLKTSVQPNQIHFFPSCVWQHLSIKTVWVSFAQVLLTFTNCISNYQQQHVLPETGIIQVFWVIHRPQSEAMSVFFQALLFYYRNKPNDRCVQLCLWIIQSYRKTGPMQEPCNILTVKLQQN